MKYVYRFINGETNEIEVDDDWGNRLLAFDCMDFDAERRNRIPGLRFRAEQGAREKEETAFPEPTRQRRRHGRSAK